MSKVFLEKRNLVAAILTVCLLTVTTGCASTVSQEEYDQLESELTQVSAELAQTKQELAAAQEEATAAQEDLHTARSVWQSAQPELELLLLMSEYVRDANLLLAHQISSGEHAKRKEAIWKKIEPCLDRIGDEELTEKVRAYWFHPSVRPEFGSFADVYSYFLPLITKDVQDLYEELGQ
ncbi:MAG: hypothetical protein H8E40_07805 [Chloroflexi bacterium]|nr:hypothetical protein [Chloroflexota bacterium]